MNMVETVFCYREDWSSAKVAVLTETLKRASLCAFDKLNVYIKKYTISTPVVT